MATPYHIKVKPTDTGVVGLPQDEAAAAKVSELLQKDLEKHHVFFNASGYHDHITHQLLTLYGSGAPAAVLQAAYDHNASYQLKAMKPRAAVVAELRDDWAAHASKYLGLGKHYAEFLLFFQGEIEAHGWRDVVEEYVFGGGAKAGDVFGRLFAGLLHPMIQLLYGLEWEQPAIIAQGLAQAAVHRDTLVPFLTEAERRADSAPTSAGAAPTLPELIESARQSTVLAESARWDDSRPLNGVLARAEEEALELASRVKVEPGKLEERTAEMIHTAAFVAAGAAFRKPFVPKFDFFLIHLLTSSPIFLAVNKHDWIPLPQKVRLLEWKMRLDLIEYVAQGCPVLDPRSISTYRPRDEKLVSRPKELLPRFFFDGPPDDGHTIKVARSLLIAEKVSEGWGEKEWARIRGGDVWLKAQYALLDSTHGGDDEARWVRGAGFGEAWKGVARL